MANRKESGNTLKRTGCRAAGSFREYTRCKVPLSLIESRRTKTRVVNHYYNKSRIGPTADDAALTIYENLHLLVRPKTHLRAYYYIITN